MIYTLIRYKKKLINYNHKYKIENNNWQLNKQKI